MSVKIKTFRKDKINRKEKITTYNKTRGNNLTDNIVKARISTFDNACILASWLAQPYRKPATSYVAGSSARFGIDFSFPSVSFTQLCTNLDTKSDGPAGRLRHKLRYIYSHAYLPP